MSFVEVASLDADRVVALGKIDKTTNKPYPKQAEGYYLGSRAVESKRGESRLHFLQTAQGNLGVWGTMDLNRKLGAVTTGTMVRITSTGTKPTPNGDMYTYKVEADTNNTIDVSCITSTESSQDDTDSDDSSTDYNTNYDDQEAEEQAQTAALLAAERKAKVEAALKSRKTAKN